MQKRMFLDYFKQMKEQDILNMFFLVCLAISLIAFMVMLMIMLARYKFSLLQFVVGIIPIVLFSVLYIISNKFLS